VRAGMSCLGDGFQEGNIDVDHPDDVSLNYEPTVSPIATGGYAWVVFTSRRSFGHLLPHGNRAGHGV